MLDIKIPKEIKEDQKIYKSLTLKQFICIACIVVIEFVLKIFVKIPTDYESLVQVMIFGVFGLIGFYKKDGMSFTQLFVRKLNVMMGKNPSVKTYRTKNKYIQLYNSVYVPDKKESKKKKEKVKPSKKYKAIL